MIADPQKSMQTSKDRPALRTLLLGGVLPVVAFAVVEELWGAKAGLIAGMAFGVAEILYEWRTAGKVQAITWGGNALLLVLGAVSIVFDEGFWFKLQPALLEGAFATALFVTQAMDRPLLVAMAKKQLPPESVPEAARPLVEARLKGMNLRMGFFFLIHTGLAVWSALYWSTGAWAMLKGAGFTVSLIAYVGLEILWARKRSRE